MGNGNSRQSFLGDRLDEILQNCTIAVVGLGGGGSQVVQQLAHIGFQRYVLCDFDSIEDTNLNRLVGSTRVDVECETPKLNIATRLIRGLHPNANIVRINGRFQEHSEALRQCDLIFGCLDGYSNRDQLERLARLAMIPFIDIGMDVNDKIVGEPPRMSGQVIASVPGYPCMHCYEFITHERLSMEAEKYGDAGENPQVIWPNGMLASTAVGIAINLLTNWTRKANEQILYYEYDGNKGTISPHLFYQRQLNKPCLHYPNNLAGDRLI